jgi:hypothetical protein
MITVKLVFKINRFIVELLNCLIAALFDCYPF